MQSPNSGPLRVAVMFKNLKAKLQTTILPPKDDDAKNAEPGLPPPPSPGAAIVASEDGSHPASPARLDEAPAEEVARLENASRLELQAWVRKSTTQARRYQTKLKDVVVAYRDLQETKLKVDQALEKQQDMASQRAKEQTEMHRKELATKSKLIDAVRRQLDERDAELAHARLIWQQHEERITITDASAAAGIQLLQEQLAEQRDKVAVAQARVAQLEAEQTQAAAQHERKLNEAQSALRERTAQLDLLKSALAEQTKQSSLPVSVADCNTSQPVNTHPLNEQQAPFQTLAMQNKQQEVEAELRLAQQQSAASSMLIATLERTITESQQQLTSCQSALRTAESAGNETKIEVASLQGRLATSSAQLTATQLALENEKAVVTALRKDLEQLRLEHDTVSTEASNLYQQATTADQQQQGLQKDLMKLQAEHDAASQVCWFPLGTRSERRKKYEGRIGSRHGALAVSTRYSLAHTHIASRFTQVALCAIHILADLFAAEGECNCYRGPRSAGRASV